MRLPYSWLFVLACLLASCAVEIDQSEEAQQVAVTAQALGPSPDTQCAFATSPAGRDYWFCDNERSWQVARDKCRAIPGGFDLASIESPTENSFILGRVHDDSWLSGSDAAMEGTWRWIATTSQFWLGGSSGTAGGAYANWKSGQPANLGNQDCAVIEDGSGNGKWNDESCTGSREFVCEGFVDLCPADPSKKEPGQCGCGTSDDDDDDDGIANCLDGCDDDPGKSAPGVCGCGESDADDDDDGTPNCDDVCPGDASRLEPPCSPDDDCTLLSHDGADYFFCENHRSYDEALANCEAVGFSLARIDDSAENDFIRQHVSTDHWVGGRDVANNGVWRWHTRNEVFWNGGSNGSAPPGVYTNWRSGEPDSPSDDDDCVQLSSAGEWRGDECDEHEQYVCEERLIVDVTVTPQQACAGQSVRIQVHAEDPSSPAAAPRVTIDNVLATSMFDQFLGAPGSRLVPVVVKGSDGYTESMMAEVEIVDCGASAPERPELYADANLFDPDSVDFTVRNAPGFADATTQYIWSFGDGTTITSPLASISHKYAAVAGTEHRQVDVTVTVRRTGVPDVSTTRTFVIWDSYTLSKRRGSIEPPLKALNEALQRIGTDLIAEIRFENRESSLLTLSQRRVDIVQCDPDLQDVVGSVQPTSVIVGANATFVETFDIPASALPATACGVMVHYWGSTAIGTPAQTSVMLERPLGLGGLELAPFASDLLDYVVAQGLVANPLSVSQEELSTLYRERKIRLDVINEVFYQSVPPPAETRGWCDPANPGPPPESGFVCQPIGGWHDTKGAEVYSQPYVANASKGDTLLVKSCAGAVYPILSRLDPPQLYTHTGVMTKNKTEVRQSYGDENFLKKVPNDIFGVGEPTDGFQEYYLRYLWPGTLTGTTEEVFAKGKQLVNPLGEAASVKGFARSEARCSGDANIVWPRVLKPAPEFETAVRPTLHQVAEASKAIDGHYRFSSYSQAPPTSAADPSGPAPIGTGLGKNWGPVPTVCSSFVRLALINAGVTMDANKALPQPSPVTLGLADGLYHYTADERLAAGEALYAYLFNKVHFELESVENSHHDEYWWAGPASVVAGAVVTVGVPVVGGAIGPLAPAVIIDGATVVDWATDAPDNVASQVTNCFATDYCADSAKNSDDWKNTTDGFAVSPDDLMNYIDPPVLNGAGQNIGGVYGYHEKMIYRGRRFQPRYAWVAAGGTRTVTGTVFNRLDDGTLVNVANAHVEIDGLGDKIATTDASGNFEIEAVPGGNIVVYASQSFADPSVPGGFEFRENRSCYVPADPDVPDGPMNRVDCDDFSQTVPTELGVSTVRVELEGPPEQYRHVVIDGRTDLRDCDCCGPQTCADTAMRTFLKTCDVGPAEPTASFSVGLTDLCLDEVGVEVQGQCTLLADNSVRIEGTVTFFEEESGSCGVGAPEGSDSFMFDVPADSSRGNDGEIINHDFCDFIFPFECDDSVDWFIAAENQVQP